MYARKQRLQLCVLCGRYTPPISSLPYMYSVDLTLKHAAVMHTLYVHGEPVTTVEIPHLTPLRVIHLRHQLGTETPHVMRAFDGKLQ